MPDAAIDPMSLGILWGRLVAIADESAGALQRASFCTTVRESNDFACVLPGPDGTTKHGSRQFKFNVPMVPGFALVGDASQRPLPASASFPVLV